MMFCPSARHRSTSSEGSIWSKVSSLFRLLLFVGMLPLIFPESEAHVTNLHLHQRTTAEYQHRKSIPVAISDLLGLQQKLWLSLPPLRRLKSTTTTVRQVERIRNSYSGGQPNLAFGSHFHTKSSSDRQRLGLVPWLLIVASACYICLKYQRWRLILSVAFLLVHFAWEEGIFPDQNVAPLAHCLRTMFAWYMTQLSVNPMLTKSITAGLIGTIGDYTAQWLEHILSVRHQARKQPVILVLPVAAAPLLRETSAARSSTLEDSAAASNATRKEVPPPARSAFPQSLSHSLSIHGRYHLRRGVSMLADGLFVSGPLMHLGYEVFERILPIADSASSSTLAALIHVVADSLLLDSFFIASRFFTTGLMEGVPLWELWPQFKSIYIPSLQASWATSLVLCPIQFSCFRYLPLSFRVLSVNCIDVIWDAVLSFMAHSGR